MMSRSILTPLFVTAALLFMAAPAQAQDPTIEAEAARTAVLAGVTTLADPGGPGNMVVWGDNAFSVANYQGSDHGNPMIAGAGWGSGRVLAVGDHQWLEMGQFGDSADTGRFYLNGIEWLAETPAKDIKIVVSPNAQSSTVSWLTAQGFTNVVQSGNYAAELADADVLIGWLGSSVAQDNLDQIESFVVAGGGLFIAEYGIGYQWWWAGGTPNAPGNRLLRNIGIGFSDDGTNSALSPVRATGQMTASQMLAVIDDPDAATAQDRTVAGTMALRLYSVLPDDYPLVAQLDARIESRIPSVNPSPAGPVTDALDKAVLTRESQILEATAPAAVVAHRQAEDLYGAVSSPVRVSGTETIDTSVPRWHPTGLYVAPGEVATVTVPAALVGQGYKVRVNAHTDNISRRSGWERPPIVHRSFDIDATTVDIANAFGGLVFIDLGNSPTNVGPVTVQVSGAVEAPYFVLGRHTDAEWNDSLRNRPAPYAVLVSDNMIISLPTRELDDGSLTQPQTLMTWWNDTVGLQDDLAAQTRTYPELANVDIQISAGAAHAGYPYQAYDRYWGNMADLNRLQSQGSWGDFHELGHNHQRGWWTFDGDVEVSVNVFSNASMEAMSPNATQGWAWSISPTEVIAEATRNAAGDLAYSDRSDRWSFWFQLADGFGWDAYRSVFAGYEADDLQNPAALPANNADEKNQWLVRFSQQVGYDLSPFMVDTWGLTVNQAALDEISALPDWMPLIGEPVTAATSDGSTVILDLTSNAHSMQQGGPSISISGSPSGTVTALGDGRWTYDPSPGFAFEDTFSFTLTSSVGNTIDVPITVTNAGLGAELTVGVANSCLSSNGRIDVSVTNQGQTPADVAVTIGRLQPRARTIAGGATTTVTATGRRDGDLTVLVESAGATIASQTVTVDCDPPAPPARIEVSCLAGNGRVDAYLTNTTGATATFTVAVGQLSPRARTLDIGAATKVSVTGRRDGDYPVIVEVNGAQIFAETVTVDCDDDVLPAEEVSVGNSCLAGRGRVDVTLANQSQAAMGYTVRIGHLERTATVGPMAVGRATVTGRPNGALVIEVDRNGQLIHTETITITC